jgi:GTP cyclohydrolase IA
VSGERQYLNGSLGMGGVAGDDVEVAQEEWAAVAPRVIISDQWQRFEGYVQQIFAAMGIPVGTPATTDTPRRFPRAIFDATSGYEGDENLVTAFPRNAGADLTAASARWWKDRYRSSRCASITGCRSGRVARSL